MSFLTKVCLPPTDKERRREYENKFHEFDEERLRRAALGVKVQLRVCERLRQIPSHHALVVIQPPAKAEVVAPATSNVVYLPTTGQHVEVVVRRPKLSIAR